MFSIRVFQKYKGSGGHYRYLPGEPGLHLLPLCSSDELAMWVITQVVLTAEYSIPNNRESQLKCLYMYVLRRSNCH